MVRLRGYDPEGRIVVDEPLRHGADPVRLLHGRGYEAEWVGGTREDDEVVLRFVLRPGRRPHPHQRVAAYAVVVARVDGRPSVLLTSLATTNRDGWWSLPGGGLEPGEHPEDAVLREVREETGQEVQLERPLTVVSAHWTGPSPRGRWEDFHAVRLVWQASCPRPRRPVVLDVGGTTAEAAWMPVAELSAVPLLEWVRPLVQAVSGPA